MFLCVCVFLFLDLSLTPCFVSDSLSLWCSLYLPPAFLFINLSLSLFPVGLFSFYLFLFPTPLFFLFLCLFLFASLFIFLCLPFLCLFLISISFFLGISISVSIIPDLSFSLSPSLSMGFSGFVSLPGATSFRLHLPCPSLTSGEQVAHHNIPLHDVGTLGLM